VPGIRKQGKPPLETWLAKSILATVCVVPAFIAIPLLKFRYGIDPLVFLVWYFGATALSIAVFWGFSGRAAELVPPVPLLIVIVLIGTVFGALANGALFQAIGLAPNPGLPPVIYATSSMIVFVLAAALSGSFPALFKPVSMELSRIVGIVLILGGLYLLAGGKFGTLFRSGG
jgi:hypothetical protein